MKNEELIKRHEVKGTPFMIIETKDRGCFIHFGAYRVSKVYRTVKECRTAIKIRPWDIICAVSLAIVTSEAQKQQHEKSKQNGNYQEGQTREGGGQTPTNTNSNDNRLEQHETRTHSEAMGHTTRTNGNDKIHN